MQCARRLPRCQRSLLTNQILRNTPSRRYVSRSGTSPSTNTNTVQQDLRLLLRDIAQPVAVITTSSSPDSSSDPAVYHGATVSSLYSISLAPYPLLSFSLRLPSRLASALKSPPPGNRTEADKPKRAVIHYLSSTQADIAHTFARGDVSADPFATLSSAGSPSIGQEEGDDDAPFFLDPYGVPVLRGCIGAVSCEVLMQGLPLDNLSLLRNLAPPPLASTSSSSGPPPSSSSSPSPSVSTSNTPRNPFAFPFDYAGIDVDEHAYEYTAEGCVHSELFIVRATQVLYPHAQSPYQPQRTPLLYYDRKYCVPGGEASRR
ncbi:flavin reductase like domain-containing protein [Pterulicium gracile]|uniref:Flavin reductase like domain-containing protein n=1 Tax=Pterulicium gracile TaxID=1884261 RepID=A0A5C3QTA2_9AGAR|nr:flavin reductase like domain-containing protein [Pterula gracilis]